MSVDWGKSGRYDAYTASLVDPQTLQETGEDVDLIWGRSSVKWDIEGENISTISLAVHGVVPENRLVRLKHSIVIPGEETFTGTIGTYFVEESEATATYHSIDRTYNGYSTLYRHTQDTLVYDFARPNGYNIAQEVRELVEADGGHVRFLNGALNNQTRCHTRDICFEVGTNKAKVLRQIADWTGSVVGVDQLGYITFAPYVAPRDRGLSYTFEDGATSVYEPGVGYSSNVADTLNRVVAHWSRDKVPTHARKNGDDYVKDADGNTIYDPDDSFGLSDTVMVNLPAYDKMSYESIGRHRTHDLRVGEPCTHEELQAQAQRYLDENGGFQDFYTLKGPSVPIDVGAKVRYINNHDHSFNVAFDCEVMQKSSELGNGCMTEWKLRPIY